MLDELAAQYTAIAELDWRINLPLALLLICASTLLLTSFRSYLALCGRGAEKPSVIVPYAVPFFGNVFAFLLDPPGFFSKVRNTHGINVPVRIRIFNEKIHLISGAESVLTLFRHSKDLTNAPATVRILENAYGVPKSLRHIFTRDNTGIFGQPIEGSNPIGHHNRYFHLSHKLLHADFAGPALAELTKRFLSLLKVEFDNVDIGYEWVELPDVYTWIQTTVFKASTIALCGPHLFDLNPDFTEQFWEFDRHITKLFKQVPRWLTPKSYEIRDKYRGSVKKWLDYAYDHADPSDKGFTSTEWEQYFGSRVMRDRNKDLGGVDGMTREARAGDDAAMIWGANANLVPCIGWEIIDIFLRPDLLARVRNEMSKILPDPTVAAGLDMPKLLANPLLQSIYCEELRLRGSVMVQRAPVIPNFKIGSFKFPENEMILASSYHEHRDPTVWNTKSNLHPLDTFWSDRFLLYPNDPTSGPRTPKPTTPSTTTSTLFNSNSKLADATNEPKFTTEPVNGSFIPYGGGQKVCPGRFYSKSQAIGAMALFVGMFDVEIETGARPEMNMEYFAFGVIPPKGVVPGRVRRRV